jgi:hypothetical protein
MIYNILDADRNVINTISADEAFVAANHPGHYQLVGPEPEPPRPPRIITKVAMLTRRLTQAEFVGILVAAKTDPAIEAWKYVFDAASQVDLDSQNTRDGMALLVSKKLLRQARADAILEAPVQPEERP